jgi:hypothetical protein
MIQSSLVRRQLSVSINVAEAVQDWDQDAVPDSVAGAAQEADLVAALDMDTDNNKVVDRNTAAATEIARNKDMDSDNNTVVDSKNTPDRVEDNNNKRLRKRGQIHPYREPDRDNTSHC